MHLTFADAAGAETLDLGASDWLRVEQQRIDDFADATDDHQWIHVDPQRAAAGPFGATIAHGYLVLSLLPRLFAEIFVLTDASMTINYGLDKVRFVHPVAAGSEIRLKAELASSTPRGDKLLLRVRGEIEARLGDGEPKRAVVLDTLFLAAPPA